MKSKAIIIFLISMTLLFFCGCHKSHDPAIVIPPGCHMTESSSSATGWVERIKVSYDGKGKVTGFNISHEGIVQGSATWTFTHDGDGNISQVGFSDGAKVIYTYNSKNQIITRENIDINGQSHGQITEEYNSTDQKVKTSYGSSYRIYTYPDAVTRNFSKVELFNGNGTLIQTYEYEYDDKKVPFPFDIHFGTDHGLKFDTSILGLTDNNPKSVKIKDDNGIFLDITSTFSYSADGYPTSIHSTFDQRGIAKTMTSYQSFSYGCN